MAEKPPLAMFVKWKPKQFRSSVANRSDCLGKNSLAVIGVREVAGGFSFNEVGKFSKSSRHPTARPRSR